MTERLSTDCTGHYRHYKHNHGTLKGKVMENLRWHISKEISKDLLQPPYMYIHGRNFFQLSVPEWVSLITQLVKNPTAMQETYVRFLGQEDRLPTPVFLGFPRLVKNPHTLGLKKLIFFLSFILNEIIHLSAPTEYISFHWLLQSADPNLMLWCFTNIIPGYIIFYFYLCFFF